MDGANAPPVRDGINREVSDAVNGPVPEPSIDLGLRDKSAPIAADAFAQPENETGMFQAVFNATVLSWLGVALGLAGLIFLAWRSWRAQTAAPPQNEGAFTDAVRAQLLERYNPQERAMQPSSTVRGSTHAPNAFGADPKFDFSLAITGGSRSDVMFTIDISLRITNRTDQAVQDLSVWGHLTCARTGNVRNAQSAKGAPIGAIERIAANQAHKLIASVQMPMTQLQAIRQGAVTSFIPLLHLTIEGKDGLEQSVKFVIGTPSALRAERLHPVALEAAPGPVQGLQAKQIERVDAPAS